jgi:hypothetical protein
MSRARRWWHRNHEEVDYGCAVVLLVMGAAAILGSLFLWWAP